MSLAATQWYTAASQLSHTKLIFLMHAPQQPPSETSIGLLANLQPAISYAAWRNSVPLLLSLTVKNDSRDTLEDLTLTMESRSGLIKRKQWTIDRIAVADEIEIGDRNVELDADYLSGLNEAEKIIVKLTLRSGDEVLAELSKTLRVLARNEWGGINSGGELLAAFVLPTDPAVAQVMKAAAKALESHGHSAALDGYQSGDPKRAYLLVSAIWNAVCGLKVTYANPPGSFEQVGQKIRTPDVIFRDGLATCLDSTLLFAAAIEAVGLNPVVVMTNGHCFCGVWLVEQTLNSILETDASEIRKALAGHELVTFETTHATQTRPGRFEDAVNAAITATHQSNESDFVAAVDIGRARMMQIRPLASHASPHGGTDATATDNPDSSFMPLATPPDFLQLPADLTDETPASPQGRIERWQRKLLDLSLRNRLLNFRSTQQSIPILCNDIAKLEDLLSDHKRLKLISLPDQNPVGDRDPELHLQKTDSDLDVEFATQALGRNEVCCQLETDQMDKRLVTLYRAARNDLAEGGTNTLFLAVGFLRWRQKTRDKKSYRAPLLLVPIKLTRKSSQSPFHLQMHEDETRFNATLIQMLKQDFGKDLSAFETDLPRDKHGVDVPQILQRIRQQVRDIAGVEVVNECALGRFSFAKYLLWKDLVDRTSQLKNNRVVRHLLEGRKRVFDSGQIPVPQPEEIDLQFDPVDLFHALDADSSQLAAVMAASADKDFVLIGPPGTGKSQTIANIISQCLATGKTVLFVAEKTAALDVVHRRLVRHGMGDCCVELHSNKAERRKFLAQLDNNWTRNLRRKSNDWVKVSSQLKLRRDQLNDYVAAIHAPQPNGWTAFEAFWKSANDKDTGAGTLGKFDWADTVRHDRVAYAKLETIVEQLADSFAAIADTDPLPMVCATDWSVKWENELIEKTDTLKETATALQMTLAQFTSAIGIPAVTDATVGQLDNLKRLAAALDATDGQDTRILYHKQFAKLPAAVQELEAAIAQHRSATQSLSGSYNESLQKIPLEDIELQWKNACLKFWPLSWFAKRAVRRRLRVYADIETAHLVNPATDIKAIGTIFAQEAIIGNSLLKEQTVHWNFDKTPVEDLKQHLRRARHLRDAMKRVGADHNATTAISKTLAPFVSGKFAGKRQAQTLRDICRSYVADLASFYSALGAFAKRAGKMPIDKQTPRVCEISLEATAFIQDRRVQLKRWTFWCQAKSKASAAGMTNLIASLESKAVTPDQLGRKFRSAYARWFIPVLVDGNPILRTFEKLQHEKAIDDFCRLDDLARQLVPGRVHQTIAHGLPHKSGVATESELGVLRHQIGLKRPSKSIRAVVTSMPEAFRKLAPCLLMSPLSIAQYLPANQPPFDVVIFDEASQITTWDAIGAIARGKQTIIVGDPRQLPPTNFFGKGDDEYDDETPDDEKDLESILDEAKASGLPDLQLNWHYRSQHESLIAFSNYQYYGNRLITFPAADNTEKGIALTPVKDAVYDKGKSRTNLKEA